MMAYLRNFPSPAAGKTAGFRVQSRWTDAFSSSLPQWVFSLSSLPSESNSPPIERLPLGSTHYVCLRGRRVYPVYRDHQEDRDWLRGDSLIKCVPAIGRQGRRGRGSRVLFRRNRVGSERGGYSKRNMQTMPCVSEFHISLVDLFTTVYGIQ